MPLREGDSLPELAAWQVQILRFTAFSETLARDEAKWWQELVGSDPENQVSRQRGQVKQSDSTFHEGRLILQTQPGRVDWMFNRVTEVPGPVPSEQPSYSPLDSLPQALDVFVPIVEGWIEIVAPLKRIAFGAVLHLPAENKEEGYRRISDFLPFNVDGKHTSDFQYRINRLRNSTVATLGQRINRLSTWGVVGVQQIVIPQGLGAAIPLAPVAMHCQLELDINNASENDEELSEQQLCLLFRELVELGKEIATKGDVP